jgi:hypothetical protein
MSVEYHIIKGGKVLDKRTFFNSDLIRAYNRHGFTISKITKTGNNTKIETFSPSTHEEHGKISDKALANVMERIKKVA